jgi:hypothetical protein
VKAILLIPILFLVGCVTAPAPAPKVETRIVDTACLWVKELTFSEKDTSETKRQIIEHDKAVRKNCPKK